MKFVQFACSFHNFFHCVTTFVHSTGAFIFMDNLTKDTLPTDIQIIVKWKIEINN